MDQKLYRDKSISRISSPEQLNDYLRVTGASVWVILAAVIILLAGMLIWSSTAAIESYAAGTGQVQGGVMTIRFDDQRFAENVQAGMPARISSLSSGHSSRRVELDVSVGREDHAEQILLVSLRPADNTGPLRYLPCRCHCLIILRCLRL